MNIEKLKALALSATHGPWEFSRDSWTVTTPDCDGDIGVYIPESDTDTTGEFIAATNPDVVLAMIDELERRQAKIDALMLEYCPGEMTAEQMAEWKRHQKKEAS